MNLPQLLNRLSLLIHSRAASGEAIHVTAKASTELFVLSQALASVNLESKFSPNDFVRAMLDRSRAKCDSTHLWAPDYPNRIKFTELLVASLKRAAICAEVAVMAATEIAYDSRWHTNAQGTREGAADLLKFIDEKVFVLGGGE